MKQYVVDAFTDKVFGGNPAAVCVMDSWLSDDLLLKITCENNLELYRELTEKHLHSIYQRHPRSIGKCLADGEGAFKLLDIEEQVKIICDIVQYTSFQRGVFSLKVLGGPKEVGRIRISGNMTEAKECKLVNYSITGMYKTEMDLLKK